MCDGDETVNGDFCTRARGAKDGWERKRNRKLEIKSNCSLIDPTSKLGIFFFLLCDVSNSQRVEVELLQKERDQNDDCSRFCSLFLLVVRVCES